MSPAVSAWSNSSSMLTTWWPAAARIEAATMARALGTPLSTGALLISRLGFAAGRPVEWPDPHPR
jgi:hypothetical protein